MDKTKLGEIKKRWERATPGNWISMYDDDKTGPVVAIQYSDDGKEDSSVEICLTPFGDDREADFDFIANAHLDVPNLLVYVQQLTAQRDALAAALRAMLDSYHCRIPAIDHNGYDPCDCQLCEKALATLAKVTGPAVVEESPNTCPIHDFPFPCPSCRDVAVAAGVTDFSDECGHGFSSSCPMGCN